MPDADQRVEEDHATRELYDSLDAWYITFKLAVSSMPTPLLRLCIIKMRQASQEIELALKRRNEVLMEARNGAD